MWFIIILLTVVICVAVAILADLHCRVRDLEEATFLLQQQKSSRSAYDGIRRELESLSGALGGLAARVSTLESSSRTEKEAGE